MLEGEFNGKYFRQSTDVDVKWRTKGKVSFTFLFCGTQSQVVTRRKSTEGKCSNNKLSNDAENDNTVFTQYLQNSFSFWTHSSSFSFSWYYYSLIKTFPRKNIKIIYDSKLHPREKCSSFWLCKKIKLVNFSFMFWDEKN